MSASDCPQDSKPGIKLGPYKEDWPWGNTASTCNIVNASVDMTTTMNNSIYNDSEQSGSNTIILAGKCTTDTCGTYHVGGNINQTNVMKQTVASASYISNSAQQKAALAIAQQATSQTKGLAPLANSSTATNVANLSARLNIAMTNTTAQRCNQTASNILVINPTGYSDVDIDATINQTNDFSQKCIQLAVDRNVASQTVVAAVSQRAFASSTGIPLWILAVIIGLIIIGFFGTLWVTIDNPAAIVILMGVVFFVIGACNFLAYGLSFNYKYVPYGYSIGLADAANCPDGGYVKLKEPKAYDSYNKALAQCKKDSNCTAFDWALDPAADNGSGTSTEYKGGVRRADKKCTKITGYTSKDAPVSDADSGTAPALMYIRPPAFRNVSLNGQKPDNSIVADVLMDVDSGNIFYKMPLPYTTCKGGQTDITNEAWNTWVFAVPSVMEATMASNAFDWVSACSTTAGTACTSNTESICTVKPVVKDLPIVTSDKRPKVFFWIDPDQSIDLQLDPTSTPASWKSSPGMNRSLKYKEFMTAGSGVTLDQTPGPEYNYNYASSVGYTEGAGSGNDKWVPAKKPTKDDYFLVPFPYTPDATVDMSGWFPNGCDGKAKNPDTGAVCTWPPPGSNSGTSAGAPPAIIKSSFGAVYYLFKAAEVKNDDGKVIDIAPDWANGQSASAGYNEQWPASPVNMVIGYGIYLGTSMYTTTSFKIGVRIQPLLYVGGTMTLIGIFLLVLGLNWSTDKAADPSALMGGIQCPLNGVLPTGEPCIAGEVLYPPSAPPRQLMDPSSVGQSPYYEGGMLPVQYPSTMDTPYPSPYPLSPNAPQGNWVGPNSVGQNPYYGGVLSSGPYPSTMGTPYPSPYVRPGQYQAPPLSSSSSYPPPGNWMGPNGTGQVYPSSPLPYYQPQINGNPSAAATQPTVPPQNPSFSTPLPTSGNLQPAPPSPYPPANSTDWVDRGAPPATPTQYPHPFPYPMGVQ